MFNSNVLDVAIGLVFLFLLLSLICSAANELLEALLKNRARNLERGISELIGDSDNRAKFLKALYAHGLINGLYRGNYVPGSKDLPSYIPAENFALAILSVRDKWIAADTTDVAALLPPNVKTAFEAFEKTAGNDFKKLQLNVEAWYNNAMDRVSGWYKRRTQCFLLAMGFAVAVGVNADCIGIAQRLSNDLSLRQGVVALAEATAKRPQAAGDTSKPVDEIKDNIGALDSLGLPIGWQLKTAKTDIGGWVQRVLGWILTALAISLGAPFWFDMLNKLIVVRSTVKPHEKSREEGSKDAGR
jgi:hypothetical protein